MAINLNSPNISSSATLIADTGLFFAPLDANNNYRPAASLGTYLSAGALPISLTQVIPVGGISPVTASAAFEINSVSGGFLGPRMTQQQRDALIPTEGMQVFVTTNNGILVNKFTFFESGTWVVLPVGAGTGDVNFIGTPPVGQFNVPFFSDTTGFNLLDSGMTINTGTFSIAAVPNLVLGNQLTNLSSIDFVTAGNNTNDVTIGISTNLLGSQIAKIFLSAGNVSSIVFSNSNVTAPSTPSAVVEIQSSPLQPASFLNARMTTAQMNSLTAVDGMQTYVTDVTPGLYVRDSGSWTLLAGAGGSFPFRESGSAPTISLYMGSGFNSAAVGTCNLGVGDGALQGLINGNNNIWLGCANVGSTINNSSGNVIVAQLPNIAPTTTLTNCTFIGHNVGSGFATTASNCAIIGNDNFFLGGPASNRFCIGNNTACNTNDSMVIGGFQGSATALNVGIGTQNPKTALHVLGGQTGNVNVQTSNYTIDTNSPGYQDYVVIGDTTSSSFAITLPSASGNQGRLLIICCAPSVSNGNLLSIKPPGGTTINYGAGALNLRVNDSIGLVSDGSGNYSMFILPDSLGGFITGIDTTNTIQDNLFIGQNSGNTTLTGTGNIGMTRNTLINLTSGNLNFAAGPASQRDNQTGSNNISVGSRSLRLNQDGSRLIAIGVDSLSSLVTGINDLIAIGDSSLSSNTTGSALLAIGSNALTNNTSGNFNLAIGSGALQSNLIGSSNLAIGVNALFNNTADKNIGIGFSSLANNTTGSFNVGIGFSTLNSLTTGSSNIAIGDTVLALNVTGSNNVGIGADALANTTGSDNLGIGFASLNVNSAGNQNIGLGSYSLFFLATGDNNVSLGYRSMNNLSNGSNNLAVGNLALQNVTSGSGNVSIGFESLQALTSGNNNISLGDGAAAALTSGDNNTVLGFQALATLGTGSNYLAIGYQALVALTSGNTGNSAVGYQALASLATGFNNTAIGNALTSITGGSRNLAIGQGAISGSTGTLNDNLAIGVNALNVSSADKNLAIGPRAMDIWGSGGDNVCIGASVAINTTSGNKSVIIGSQAAPSLATCVGNVLIGEGVAGTPTTTLDNCILIGNGTDCSNNLSQATAIGAGATVTASNSIVLGSTENIGIGVTAPLAKLHVVGGQIVSRNTVSTPYSIASTDYVVSAPTSSTPATPFSVTLPNADTNVAMSPDGQVFYIKDSGGNATLNNITIDAGGTVTIDGALTAVINSDYGSLQIISDGTNYFIV